MSHPSEFDFLEPSGDIHTTPYGQTSAWPDDAHSQQGSQSPPAGTSGGQASTNPSSSDDNFNKFLGIIVGIANKHGLSADAIADLQTLARLTRGVLPLESAQMIIYFAVGQLRLQQAFDCLKLDVDRVNYLAQELEKKIEEIWDLSPALQAVVLKKGKELAVDPSRTSWSTLSTELEAFMRNDPRFSDAYHTGKDNRESKGDEHAKGKAKNARNQLRGDIISSVTDKAVSLEKATSIIVLKFHPRAASNGELAINHLLHMALVRRFVLENPDCCNIEADDADADGSARATSLGSGDDDSATTNKRPAKRRRITTGRTPKNQDFFSVLERWFSDKMKEFNSTDLAGPEWREYLKETIHRDHAKFGVSSLPNVARLPNEYIAQRNPSTPAPFGASPARGQHHATHSASAEQQSARFQHAGAPVSGPNNGASASLAGAGGAGFFGSFSS